MINKLHILAIILINIFSFHAKSQSLQQDSLNYAYAISNHTYLATIPNLNLKLNKLDSATNIYFNLSKHSWLSCQDRTHFLRVAYQTGNSEAFSTALYMMMQITGESVGEILKRYVGTAPLYRNTSLFQETINKLYNQNDSLLEQARSKLDWSAILMIYSMLISDQEYRSKLPEYIFKDSSQLPEYKEKYWSIANTPTGKIIGYETLDSIHLYTLYNYIKENGFPSEKRTGCYCGLLWVIMRHGLDLLTTGQVINNNNLNVYKFIIPIIYEYVIKNEFPSNWYEYVFNDLIKLITKYSDTTTLNYFKKYKLQENDLDTIK